MPSLNESLIKNSYLSEKLSKIVSESIDRLLIEELSISDDVGIYTDTVYNLFREKIAKKEFNKSTFNDYNIYQTIVNAFVFGEIITIIFNDYRFNNFETYISISKEIIKPSYCDFDNKTIVINGSFRYIDEYSIKKLLIHELLHFYQSFKQGHNFITSKQYKIASENMTNNNEEIKLLSRGIYLSVATEQDAIIHEMYKDIYDKFKPLINNENYILSIDNKELNYLILQEYKKSECYNWLLIMRKCIDYLEKNNINDETMKLFNINNQNNFNNILKKYTNRFETKTNKAFIKTRNEIIKDIERKKQFLNRLK